MECGEQNGISALYCVSREDIIKRQGKILFEWLCVLTVSALDVTQYVPIDE